MRTNIAILSATLLSVTAAAHDAAPQATTGPADNYVYSLAEPGTYTLPPIRRAGDATLLDETGRSLTLNEIFGRRYVLLAFIYTRCGDICPTTSLYMSEVQRLVAEDPQLSRDFAIVSVSLDPDHDTPDRMARYATAFRDDAPNAPQWHFLTASSVEQIDPVLAAYRQPVVRNNGAPSSAAPIGHLLRVFLIDREGMVRNIYSADFLDRRIVINDLRTLKLEERQSKTAGPE